MIAPPTDPERKREVLELLNDAFIRRVPHNKALGLHVVDWSRGEAVLDLPYDPRLIGDPHGGVLHGGAITSLMDASCGAAIYMGMRQPVPIATLDLRIDYLRPAEPQRDVVCRSSVVRITRHVAFVRAVAHHGDETTPIATSAATFMVFQGGQSRVAGDLGRPRERGTKPPAAGAEADEPSLVAELVVAGDPATRIEAIAAAKAAGRFPELVGAIPYSRFLGLSCAAEGDGLVAKLAFARRNVGNAALPALHGGTIGALLESAAIFELLWRGSAALPKTITLTIDYMRSGRPIDTFARATITRQGRRIANVHAVAWQDDPDKPIASANLHLLVEGDEHAAEDQST